MRRRVQIFFLGKIISTSNNVRWQKSRDRIQRLRTENVEVLSVTDIITHFGY